MRLENAKEAGRHGAGEWFEAGSQLAVFCMDCCDLESEWPWPNQPLAKLKLVCSTPAVNPPPIVSDGLSCPAPLYRLPPHWCVRASREAAGRDVPWSIGGAQGTIKLPLHSRHRTHFN